MPIEPGTHVPARVDIIEVGPRDGLQREQDLIPTHEKVSLIEGLVAAGLKHIQVTSFVHPRRVPQMADAEELCARLPRHPGVSYSGLALNLKGVDRAHAAGLEHIDISISASNTHSLRNANRTLEDALSEFDAMHARARACGMHVRAGIQCAFGYQHAKDVSPDTVVALARRHLALGVDALALADSAGLANPRQVIALLEAVVPLAGEVPVILHLHDTRGMGLANLMAALSCGVRAFDTSFGGLGGCPFIEGATGNIATEDTVYMLQSMGIETGVDIASVARLSRHFEVLLKREALPGKIYRITGDGMPVQE